MGSGCYHKHATTRKLAELGHEAREAFGLLKVGGILTGDPVALLGGISWVEPEVHPLETA